jgi:hypothetical protein
MRLWDPAAGAAMGEQRFPLQFREKLRSRAEPGDEYARRQLADSPSG